MNLFSEEPKSGSKPLNPGANVVSKDVQIEGSIKFINELVIDGKFDGEIIGDGALTVGQNADVHGEIKTRSVLVLGKITGNITVIEGCALKAGAHFKGDLKASRLLMEDGATFLGTSEVPSSKDGAPRGKASA